MADPILTASAVSKLTSSTSTYLSIIDGVLRVRVEGYVVQKLDPDQFPTVVDELREHGWYTRRIRTYASGDFAMCARYPSDESEEGRDTDMV